MQHGPACFSRCDPTALLTGNRGHPEKALGTTPCPRGTAVMSDEREEQKAVAVMGRW